MTAGAPDGNGLRALFATSPTEFVAARNEMAKVLRKEKRREEASAIAALRRPGWVDWALNVVATESAPTVTAFADAAAAVRDAQAAAIEGRDGPDVRSSLRDLRDSSAALVGLAGDVLGRVDRTPTAGEINGRLSEVAASTAAVEQLRAGVLGSGEDTAADLFAGLQPSPGRQPRPASKKRAAAAAASDTPTKPSTDTPAKPSTDTPAEPSAADIEAARAERAHKEDELREARAAQRVAAKAVASAEAGVAKATASRDRAKDALDAAAADLAAIETTRDAAVTALGVADEALAAARAGVDPD
ncbi:MAG: hypothetical protein ABW328_09130 [Ilumatobacteraceae bacterium]